MKHNIYTDHTRRIPKVLSLNSAKIQIGFGLLLLILGQASCSDFVEIDPPKNILVSEEIFNNPATVESALANIYFNIREQGMVSGRIGLTTAMGVYGDNLDYFGFDASLLQFYNHNVTASNTTILGWWSNAYNLIYSANDVIAGVENSDGLSLEDQERFKGQALFVRAYLHSLLVSLFGDVPYITTTDHIVNGSVGRQPEPEVFEHIIADLSEAVNLLEGMEVSGERVNPDQSVARALLARAYLYNENWEMAEVVAGQLIAEHSLEPNIENVFLKESSETLWQLKPGDSPVNTQEANELIILFIPGHKYALTDELITAFESGDLRMEYWTGSITNEDGTITLRFAHKYKATLSETESLEYSIVFRMAEQYLLRAEARAKLGDLSGAQDDLNTIRNRAGLSNTMANSTMELLDAILQERRVEFFAEHGHRWFDLKRTGSAGTFIPPVKPNWQDSQLLLPIPESELGLNPNLLPQNDGY